MKQNPVRGHRWAIVFPIAIFAILAVLAFDWFRETNFDEPGKIVNAIYLVTVTVLMPGIFAGLIWTGQFRPPADRFLEQGYLGSASLSRGKPGPVAPLIGLAVVLILGSIAVGMLVDGLNSASFELPPHVILILLPILAPIFVYLWLILYLFARFWVNRDIVRHMASLSSGETTAGPRAEKPQQSTGDLTVQIISVQPKPVRRVKGVTQDSNCLAQEPLRLLYLWNFDVGFPLYDINSWRQFGPVYWLWGPGNIPVWRYLQMARHRNPAAHFASTQAKVDQWLDRSREAPQRGILGRRYPELPIACMSNIWQVAVQQACNHVDAVIVDARSFTAERSGLSWEVAHVVRKLPPERYLLLADITTDIRAFASLVLSEDAGGTARILYPPLLREREALKQMFDRDEVPHLNYSARSLVHLLTAETPDLGTAVTLNPLAPAS
jgi:hypothetical protein